MAAYTSLAAGEWNNQANWNDGASGYPDGADDTASVSHAMTCAAGIVCGAVTSNAGGDVNTGAAASTITSITTASTGTCTIGAGGATLAGVLNNAGTGLLTISGAVTGCTTFTPRSCTQNAAVACTAVTGPSAAADIWNINANLTGMTGTSVICSGGCTVNIAAGVTISFNSSGSTFIFDGNDTTFTIAGTSGSHVTINNVGAGNALIGGSNDSALYGTISYLDSNGGSFAGVNLPGSVYIYDSEFTRKTATATVFSLRHNLFLSRCFIGQGATGVSVYRGGGKISLHNCAIGYERNGTSRTLTTGLYCDALSTGFIGRNVIVNATTQVSLQTTVAASPDHGVVIDNLSHLIASMLPGTASALDLAVVDAGVGKTWNNLGTVERSTANPRTGTHHDRHTASSTVTTSLPLDISIYVPIASGQAWSASVYASRSAMSSDCAKFIADPEAAWGTTQTSVQLLTNPATYYELTISGTAAAGTATGMLRLVLRVDEYEAAATVDFDDLVIIVSGIEYDFSFDKWQFGAPTLDVPDYPAVADVEDGVFYDFGNYEGTLVGAAGGLLAANKRGNKL